jgi:hypothetical protein
MLLESVEEFIKNIFLRFLAALHIGVTSGIVHSLKILYVDDSTAVTVKFAECDKDL